MSRRLHRLTLALLLCIACSLHASRALAAESKVALAQIKTTLLRKPSGHVHQVLTVPSGGFIVRDSNFSDETAQAVELYSDAGYYCGQFGSFGRGPGLFYRLKSIAISADQTLWLADVIGRISRFNMEGALVGTKLIQRPAYQVDWVLLDEARGVYYLAGYLPKKVYIDYGSQLIHKYDLAKDSYRQSFLDNDPGILVKNLPALSDVVVDADARGRLYVVDAPIMKLTMLDPVSGKSESVPINSQVIKPVGALEAGVKQSQEAFENSYLIDRVVVGDAYTLVSVREPKSAGFVLQIFTNDGRQVGSDVASPGQLVGKTANGHFYFVRQQEGGFELAEFEVSTGNGGKQTGTRGQL
jgi:hypothetical protein